MSGYYTPCSNLHYIIYTFPLTPSPWKAEVYRVRVYMRHWGAKSCKPTFLWSNSKVIHELNMGKLTAETCLLFVVFRRGILHDDQVSHIPCIKYMFIKSPGFSKETFTMSPCRICSYGRAFQHLHFQQILLPRIAPMKLWNVCISYQLTC